MFASLKENRNSYIDNIIKDYWIKGLFVISFHQSLVIVSTLNIVRQGFRQGFSSRIAVTWSNFVNIQLDSKTANFTHTITNNREFCPINNSANANGRNNISALIYFKNSTF